MFKDFFRKCTDGCIYAESLVHRRAPADPGRKRVLIMRKDGLGDCIVFYPTLRAYRDFYKDAEVTLIFPKYFESLSPLLSKDLVDRVIWFDHKAFGSSFAYRRKFLLDLKRAGYDVFIYPVFSRETIGAFMMRMTGAPERIGFEGEISDHGRKDEASGKWKYTRLVKPPAEMKREIDRDAYFAKEVTGREVTVSFPTIDVALLPKAAANALVERNGLAGKRYAVVFPGAGVPYRIWQKEKWAAAVDHLADRGVIPVIAGSAKEEALVEGVLSLAKSRASAVNISGQTDLATLARLLAGAALYFGSDTGVLHLAVAVGCPAVAIVGMGGLGRFFPYGDPKRNRAVYDRAWKGPTGQWDDFSLEEGVIHPSIAAIRLDDAEREIDAVIGMK